LLREEEALYQRLAVILALPQPEYEAQAKELVDLSAGLTDQQKTIAEYWLDGPNSEQPPGHWALFAQFVSARDHHTLDDDVKMFFALSNAMLDASIEVWDCKRHYDSVRPISQIRYMGGLGQSSDAMGPSYDPNGLPLVPGLIEVITAESSAPGERHGGVDVAHEQDPDTRVGLPIGQHVGGLLDGRKYHLDLRRHTHPVEILLPVAAPHFVIHEDDEGAIEGLAPSHDHLAVDETVVDPEERDAHAAVTRMALAPASAARRAASAGVTSR